MKQTALQRLIGHTHSAVFDKAPQSELALRVGHASGASWSIADEVLTVQAGAAPARTYNLAALTIGQLSTALQADGFEVPAVASSWAGQSAMALAESAGNSFTSNGDRIGAFTSLLWVLMSGYAPEVREAEHQVGEALRQMIIPQAEGEWLDVWGTLYGSLRRGNETDGNFSQRIPQEAFRQRVNAHGIEKAILDLTGWDVRIEEPWRLVFRLDESELSGPHKFYDGDRIGYHLIQPTAKQQVDWDLVLEIIERNKPAGVIVLSPLVRRLSYVDASAGLALHTSLTSLHARFERYSDAPLLDESLYLDDGSSIILNHAARHLQERLHGAWIKFDDQGFPGAYTAYESKHFRDYRVHYTAIDYRSQYWTSRRSWSSAKESWSGLTTIIDSKHTRGS